jgi:exosortase A
MPDVGGGVVHPLSVPASIAPAGGDKGAWPGSVVVLAFASTALAWAFRGEIAAAVQVWSNSATFGHAFFIAPICLFLFYRARHRLALLQPSPAPWATVLVAMLAFAWVIGEMANVVVVKQLALVGLWQALFLLVLGWRITRAALFPLLFLYFAVPVGSSAIPVLQDLTAQMVAHLLRTTGIPVFLDGFVIQIPSGSFLVAEACSGVRYLIVSLALGVLAAHLFLRSWPRRLLFVGLSIVIPILANGIRAYSIIMLAHLTDYRTAGEFDHVLYGFLFLGIVTVSLLGLAALLRDRHGPDAGAPAVADVDDRLQRQRPTSKGGVPAQAAYGGAALALIFLAQAWTAVVKEPPVAPVPALLLPHVTAPWQTAADGEPGWQPDFHGHDLALQGSYRLGSDQVDLRVAYYSHQREGAEAISDMNNLVGAGKQWRALQVRRATIPVRGKEHPYVRMLLGGRGDSYIVWYWYRVGGQSTSSRMFGKLLELKTLLGGDRAASVVAIGSRVSADAQRTEALLGAFLNQHLNSDGTLVRLAKPPTAAAPASP